MLTCSLKGQYRSARFVSIANTVKFCVTVGVFVMLKYTDWLIKLLGQRMKSLRIWVSFIFVIYQIINRLKFYKIIGVKNKKNFNSLILEKIFFP